MSFLGRYQAARNLRRDPESVSGGQVGYQGDQFGLVAGLGQGPQGYVVKDGVTAYDDVGGVVVEEMGYSRPYPRPAGPRCRWWCLGKRPGHKNETARLQS